MGKNRINSLFPTKPSRRFSVCINRTLLQPQRRGRRHETYGDDEILQLFYHRVEYAISAVEEKYGRLCRSVARGILKDERDVEECVNDTCMRAWNAIPPEKPRSLEAYLVRITRNLALDRYAYHHSQKRETALTEAYEELEACLPLAKDGPEEAAMVQELQRTLNDFLRAQPEDARRFFLRRYWYGESIAEIAEACGASSGRIRSSLFRTRARLRRRLEEEGVFL